MNTAARRLIAALLSVSITATTLPAAAYDMPTPREELRAALVERGVASAEAKARVAALTDEEVAQVSAQIEALPAGAGGGGGLISVALSMIIIGTVMYVAVYVILPVAIVGTVVYAVASTARKAPAKG